jgi:DNA-binding NarL/FixJ family response regulator
MKLRVVIVDDHATLRRSARRLLELGGFDVVGEAVDGASGVELARELEPDVLLLDVVLPDMSGFDVAERVVGSKVVLVSSRARTDFGLRLDQSRAIGFISKDELSMQALRELLEAA